MDRTLNLPFGVESGTLDVTVKVYRNLMPSTRTTSRLLEVTIPPPHFLVRNAHTADRLWSRSCSVTIIRGDYID